MNSLNEEQKEPNLTSKDSSYECHICLEIANEPILTQCGHLFCWPCIYHVLKIYFIIKWLHSNQEFLTCPVCKNGINLKLVIPIYTREEELSEEKIRISRDQNIPPRPKPERSKPQRNNNSIGNNIMFPRLNNLQDGTMLAGYGLFPSVYNLINLTNDDFSTVQNDPNHLNEELMQVQRCKLALKLFLLAFFIMFILYI